MLRFSDLPVTEPGFGARFTYNINKHVAVEAELSLFPRERQDDFPGLYRGGHKTQALFGIKAGKRSERFGFFGKARPGFVNFSRFIPVFLCCTNVFQPDQVNETDFALDVGGVAELYTSGRTFVRVDVGDTIIHSNSGKRRNTFSGK